MLYMFTYSKYLKMVLQEVYTVITESMLFFKDFMTLINVLVSANVINRSKPIDITIKCFRLLVLSEARTRFDDMTKNQTSNNLISLLNEQILHFPVCLEKGDG